MACSGDLSLVCLEWFNPLLNLSRVDYHASCWIQIRSRVDTFDFTSDNKSAHSICCRETPSRTSGAVSKWRIEGRPLKRSPPSSQHYPKYRTTTSDQYPRSRPRLPSEGGHWSLSFPNTSDRTNNITSSACPFATTQDYLQYSLARCCGNGPAFEDHFDIVDHFFKFKGSRPCLLIPFRRFHDDFDVQNVLSSADDQLANRTSSNSRGVLKWEHSYFGPVSYLYKSSHLHFRYVGERWGLRVEGNAAAALFCSGAYTMFSEKSRGAGAGQALHGKGAFTFVLSDDCCPTRTRIEREHGRLNRIFVMKAPEWHGASA